MRVVSIFNAVLALSVCGFTFEAAVQDLPDKERGVITGAVTDPTGAFVSNARITATDESSGAGYKTTTDTTGSYRLSNIPAGRYRLTCEAEGFRKYASTAVEAGPARVRLDVSLPSPQEAHLSCSCSMDGDSFERLLRTTSAPDPEIALHISTKSSSVVAGSEVWLTVAITNITDHTIFIPLEHDAIRAFAYEIGVWDTCNCPIGGAQIGQLKGSEPQAHRDVRKGASQENPGYVLILVPGGTLTDSVELSKLLDLSRVRTYIIRAQLPDTASAASRGHTRSPLFVRSNRISVTVAPPRTGSISGKVVDPTGAVIPAARVTATEESTGKQSQATTALNGEYRFPALPVGKYSVKFEARGFRTETKAPIAVDPDKMNEVDISLAVGTGGGVEVTSKPAPESANQLRGRIHGRVTDAAGAVPARITATDQATRQTYTTTTDSEGVYQLADLPASKFDLRFETDGTYDWRFARDVAVSPPRATDLDIVMRRVRELVEICSGPLIELNQQPVYAATPGIQLRAYAEHNVVTAGSDLWLTVTLTNTTRHSIFIRAGEEPGAKFGYKIYASGPCVYDRELSSQQTSVRGGPIRRVTPGQTLTDRVVLTTRELGRGTFTVAVRRPDTSSEPDCCEETKSAPLVKSNEIKVTVLAP